MRPWLVCALIFVAGCSGKSPDEKLADDLQPASSWTAALAFATEGWVGNRVPSSFMRESIKSAEKAFEKAEQTVGRSNASETLRDTANRGLRDGRDAASELNGALERGDREAARRARLRLLAAHQSLEGMKQR